MKTESNDLNRIRQIVENRVYSIIKEYIPNSYEMEDPDITEDEDDDFSINGYGPKVSVDPRNIPVESPFNSSLGMNRDVDFNHIEENPKNVSWKERSELNPEKEIVFHGRAIGKMGTIIKVDVASFEKDGVLKRPREPLVKYIQAHKLTVEENPPSLDNARLIPKGKSVSKF